VMVMGSSNDAWHGLDPTGSRANLSTVISRLRKADVGKIVYSTSHTFTGDRAPKKYAPYAAVARQLMQRYESRDDVMFIDMAKAFATYDLERFYTFVEAHNDPLTHVVAGETDTTHPNKVGQAYIAKLFLKLVFDIDFDPPTYLHNLSSNHKYPGYRK